MNPLVSVIIPNYNHAKYLPERIESVLNQSFQDFEVILLDDNSSDSSRDVIEKYRNQPKVSHIIFNEVNSGSTFKQWQKGINLAKGEWIWFAESDDYCEPTLLEALLKNIGQCHNVVVSYCQSYIVEEGKELKNLSFFTDSVDTDHWKKDYCGEGVDEINKCLLYKCTIPNASAAIFKKSAFLKADKAFTSMRFCGDWMLWVQLLKMGNIAFSAQPLNYFRFHNATTRVLDTFQRRKLRAEEEYEVVANIVQTVAGDKNKFSERIDEALSDYIKCFTTKDFLKLLFSPVGTVHRVPYGKVLTAKLKRVFSL